MQHGDHMQAAICAVALDDEFSEPTLDKLTHPQRLHIYAMTVAEARAMVVRALLNGARS